MSEKLLKTIEENLDGWIESQEMWLSEKAHNATKDFDTVSSMPIEELPTHINEKTFFGRLCIDRLAGRELDTPENWMEVLHDVEFDCEDYKNIGVGDGQMDICSTVYNLLGKEDKAKKAMSLRYS
jgi:hypothetical protein